MNQSTAPRTVPRTSQPLTCPSDHQALSELMCFVRSQLEAFVVTEADGGDSGLYRRYAHIRRSDGQTDVGRVGIRCVHCHSAASREDGKMALNAASFPKSTSLVYQAARNWQRYHLMQCPTAPRDFKERYLKISGKRGRSKKHSAKYWEKCCRNMGMVDGTELGSSEEGVRLRTGEFEDGAGDLVMLDLGLANVVNSNNVEQCSDQARSVDDIHGYNDGMNDGVALLPVSPVEEPQARRSSNSAMLDPARGCEQLTSALHEGPCVSILSNRLDASIISLKDASTTVDKLKASLSLIEAARQMRCSPKGIIGDNNDGSLLEDEDNVLQLIGAGMYELFAGMPPTAQRTSNRSEERGDEIFGDDLPAIPPGSNHESCNNSIHQNKRERRLGTDSSKLRKPYVPLVDLGAPPAVCALVSRLLDCTENDGSGGGVRVNRFRWRRRGTSCNTLIDEVEEDLHFLAARPELLSNRVDCGKLALFGPNGGTIFGREKETAALLDAYDRATSLENWCGGQGTRDVVLVSGYSGTGKSSLVWNVRAHFAERGASFILGKYDAMQQLSPLSAIMLALGDYCDLLARDEGRINEVREAVTAAFSSSGGSTVLLNLVPNMHKIIKANKEDNSNDQREFTFAGRDVMKCLIFQVRTLFRATCSRENPVVMCLDDLQWADEVSLELMHALVSDSDIQGLLFIGCFRDNEVGAGHPLMARLESIRQSHNVNVSAVHLGNLDMTSLNKLISESLRLPPGTTFPLAEAVLSKTDGNALFSVQFLSSLHDEGMLYFSLISRRWEWNINKILSKDISDSVVEVMVVKLLKLELEVQEALKMAAAFGGKSEESLFEIIDRSADGATSSTINSLDEAVVEGLMIKNGSSYRFSHDQIQCAAYFLIPETDQLSFHLRMGQLLWKLASEEELVDNLFVVVNQLHIGASLITDKSEKINLCELSLLAGKKSSAMSAFLPAASYLNAGIVLLAAEDWEINRKLCFDLYNSCAEAEYILGKYVSMNCHIEEILQRASTLQEQLRANFTLVQSLGSMGCVSDAIHTAMSVLSQLGESFPACVTEAGIHVEMATTRGLLLSKSDDEILKLALMEDPEKLSAMKFLQLITLYVYAEKKEYLPAVVCRMVRLSLSHGVCKESAVGFAFYGAAISFLDSSLAYRVGRISLILLKKFDASEYLAQVCTGVYGFINPMVEPIQASLPCLKEAVETGIATGDTGFAMIAANVYGCDALFSGKLLGPLADEVDLYLKQMLEHKQHFAERLNRPLRDFILKLLGKPADHIRNAWAEASRDDEAMRGIQSKELEKVYLLWYHYLFGEYDIAWNIIKEGVAGERFSFACTCNFYMCLTALALAREERKKAYMDVIDRGLAKIKRVATSSPWNCGHKLQLLEAEYAFLEGNHPDASEAYDVAINLAQKHSFIHEQALCLERAGIFYLHHCDNSKASKYFSKAFDCYEKWGACRKSAYVKDHYL